MNRCVLSDAEPLAYPAQATPRLFGCMQCSRKVTREHIHVWQWRSHDHIRGANVRTAQLCDQCAPIQDKSPAAREAPCDAITQTVNDGEK